MSTPEVKTVKLINGEEFLCTIPSQTESTYNIHKPMVLSADHTGNFQLMPWMLVEDETLVIGIDKVLAMGEAMESLAKGYLDATTERLIDTPPEKKLVLPN